MKLADFTTEIIAISKANGNADMVVATELFLNNIKDAVNPDEQYHYAGADPVDYAALKPNLKELTEDKQNFLEAY